MKNTTRILVLEDITQDYELTTEQLERAGPRRVTAKGDATDDQKGDGAALKWSAAPDSKAPVVVVTGELWENAVVWSRECGADECVLQGRLTDLASAAQHASQLSEERRRRKEVESERDQLRAEVEALRAWNKIPGALPICADCKKIKDGAGMWAKLEHYFHQRLGIRFTHGLCPVCMGKYFTEIEDFTSKQKQAELSATG